MSNPNPPAPPEQQIQQAIEQVKTEQQLNKNGGMPLEVTLETGEKYVGTTPQELLDKLVQGKTEASKAIKAERDRNAELQAQISMLQQQIPQASPSDADKQRKIQDRYKTWSENPTEATKQDLADLLGVPVERVVDVMREAIGSSVVNKAADEFLARCPDFPQTPQTASLMRDELSRRYGTTPDAASADNLELVYHQLVREGRIQPQAMAPSALMNANTPIPNLRGGSAPPNPVNDLIAQARTMPLEQLKQVLDRLTVSAR